MIFPNETVARGLDSFKLIFNEPDKLFTVLFCWEQQRFFLNLDSKLIIHLYYLNICKLGLGRLKPNLHTNYRNIQNKI